MPEKKETSTLELPRLIDVPYPYIVLGDLDHVVSRLLDRNDRGVVKQIQREVLEILLQASPDGSTFMSASMAGINKRLEEILVEEMEAKNGDLGVVLLDRYIGDEMDFENLFRLNLSRGINGKLNSRPGSIESPDEQVARMVDWVEEGGYSEMLLVDDVLAFGDTLVPLVNLIKEHLPESKIRVVVGLASSGGGWSGKERVLESTGVEVEAVTTVKAGEENEWTSGMALPTSRDFTFLGGKVLTDTAQGVEYNFPYFLPFSSPVISFMPKEVRFEISSKLMDLSIKMIDQIDRINGRPVTLGDMSDAGFGIPWSNIKCLQELMPTPSRDIKLREYLEYFQYLLENFQDEILGEINA